MSDVVQVAAKVENCHTVIILDRSGSMDGMRREAVDAFNQQLDTIKEESKNIPTKLSLVTFSTVVDNPIIWDQDPESVEKLVIDKYCPDGLTAMLDAVGYTIDRLKKQEDSGNPGTVYLLVIISDGYENNSKKEGYESIASKITECRATNRWTITYLGANQDLAQVSHQTGIDAGSVCCFMASVDGMKDAGRKSSRMMKGVYSAYYSGSRSVDNAFGDVDDASQE